MQLTIDHVADRDLGSPTSRSVHYLRLTPRDESVQTRLDWQVEGAGRIFHWLDGFGNHVHCLVTNADHQSVRIRAHGTVETRESHGVIPVVDSEPPPDLFLTATARTKGSERIRDFLAPLDDRLRMRGALSALHELMAMQHDAIAWEDPSGRQSALPDQILDRNAGSCQDHAHLFIACCQIWNIPARFVSGYLHGGGGCAGDGNDGRLVPTHAWAEALVDHLGWVSFDPCNRLSATPAYVRLAVGRNADDTMPVRGFVSGVTGNGILDSAGGQLRIQAIFEQ